MNPPRLAATVILVRPPFEIYLTRRSGKSSFAPDAYVFPGGTVDAQDESGPQDAVRMAAVRELFEEAGLLLVRDAAGKPLDAASTQWGRIAYERVEMREGRRTFAEFLSARGWLADTAALVPFSHWITPPSEPRRYDTHFFFATAPLDQVALADAIETHDGIWIAPADALARRRAGTMHLVYPTIKHLERLAPFSSAEAALAFALAKRVITVEPTESADGRFAIPPELENAW